MSVVRPFPRSEAQLSLSRAAVSFPRSEAQLSLPRADLSSALCSAALSSALWSAALSSALCSAALSSALCSAALSSTLTWTLLRGLPLASFRSSSQLSFSVSQPLAFVSCSDVDVVCLREERARPCPRQTRANACRVGDPRSPCAAGSYVLRADMAPVTRRPFLKKNKGRLWRAHCRQRSLGGLLGGAADGLVGRRC